MAPISSAGNYAIPASQPSRNPAEKVTEKASDEQSQKPSEQVKTEGESQTLPPVAQIENQIESEISAEEQQKIEAAQQEAQRAEFDQQAGNVREAEPNAVRPPSSTAEETAVSVQPQPTENPAIDIFVQLQNINNPPRQGQEVNRFA